MKRILVIVLSISLLVSCMIFSVSATEATSSNSFGRSQIDFLVADSYRFLANGGQIGSNSYPGFTVSASNNFSVLSFEWDLNIGSNFSGFTLSLYATQRPTSVVVTIGGQSLEAGYIGTSYNVYNYEFTGDSRSTWTVKDVKVKCTFSSVYNGKIAVMSFFGQLTTSVILSSMDYIVTQEVSVEDSSYVYTLDEANGVAPTNITGDAESGLPFNLVLQAGGSLKTSNAVSVSYLIQTIGNVDILNDISVGVYSSSGDLKWLVPTVVDCGNYYPIVTVPSTGESVTRRVYCITADLTDVNLSQYSVELVMRIQAEDLGSFYRAGFHVLNYCYRTNSYSTPWYISFYHWISGTLTNGFNSVVDAITGGGSNDAAADDMVSDAEQKADDAAQLQQDMQIQKPVISTPTGDIGDSLSAAGVAPLATTLAVITNNSIVGKLLILVFTLALCAYVFFGKR